MPSNEWRELRATHICEIADQVVQIELAALNGLPLEGWEPGAHIEIQTTAGLVRQYSLCGPYEADSYTIAVLLSDTGGGGSKFMHSDVEVGSILTVRGPRNHFPLTESAPHYLLIAGGIGITPIKAMAERLEVRGKPWRLHYGGRTRAGMAYAAEMHAMSPSSVFIHAEDEVGLMDIETIIAEATSGTVVYCCGPAGLLEKVAATVESSAVQELNVERFTGTPSVRPASEDEGEAFVVEMAASGHEVVVVPGQSILDAVREISSGIMSSCEDGYCGTCETRVISGIPDHRDTILTPSEQAANDTMMICVGRSRSPRLVLDL